MAAKDRVVATIKACPRCKAPHERIQLKAFDVMPEDGYGWYGECPQTRTPITAKVTFNVEAR